MPRKLKPSTSEGPLAPIPAEILNQFVHDGPLTHEELETVVRRFKKAIIERALGGELTHHLGYAVGEAKPEETTNHRNGSSGKTVLTDDGPLALAVPRDRDGTFEPCLIGKHERRFTGFDDKVWRCARDDGAFKHLDETCGVASRPARSSRVTDAVVAEVTAWQSRPLEPMYPVVFFDALRVKIRDEAVVRSKAVYLALAVLPDGTRDILGIWIEQTEGAKFWLKVFTDLKARGCQDILIAVTDGLKGMGGALAAALPATTLQTCIVHLVRHSLDYVSWKERKHLAAAPALIYGGRAEAAAMALVSLPMRARLPPWRLLAPGLDAYHSILRLSPSPPRDLRTNAIESVNARLRKILAGPPTPGHQTIWLALRNITALWGHKAANDWHLAKNQFAILYEDRFTAPPA